jgi:hypothetical protein
MKRVGLSVSVAALTSWESLGSQSSGGNARGREYPPSLPVRWREMTRYPCFEGGGRA